jgi:hypothetical protein
LISLTLSNIVPVNIYTFNIRVGSEESFSSIQNQNILLRNECKRVSERNISELISPTLSEPEYSVNVSFLDLLRYLSTASNNALPISTGFFYHKQKK